MLVALSVQWQVAIENKESRSDFCGVPFDVDDWGRGERVSDWLGGLGECMLSCLAALTAASASLPLPNCLRVFLPLRQSVRPRVALLPRHSQTVKHKHNSPFRSGVVPQLSLPSRSDKRQSL